MASSDDRINNQSRLLKRYVKLYVIPIVAVVLFLGILLVLVIPKINEIFLSLDEISSANQKIAEFSKKINEYETLYQKSNLMAAQLKIIDETTPTGVTEVVSFRDKISGLVAKNGLKSTIQQLSENDLGLGNSTSVIVGGSINLQEIPFIFEIEGNYSNIVSFISDLSNIDDFIIVKEMELSNSGIQGEQLKLRIDKYQFNVVDQSKLSEIYLNVPPTATISQSVLDYVNQRLNSRN